MTVQRTVVLEQRGTGKLSKEEQAIKDYLVVHHPDVAILEIPLKKVTRGFVDKLIVSAELVAGSVEFVERAARRFGHNIDLFLFCNPYPLSAHEHRQIRTRFMWQIKESDLPVFIKPIYATKAFTGFVCNDLDDFRLSRFGKHNGVYTSSVVKFVSEYRYYGHGGKYVPSHYDGDPSIKPDQAVVDEILSKVTVGVVDIGVLDTGETAIVECCQAYSIGLYEGCPTEHYYNTLVEYWGSLKRRHVASVKSRESLLRFKGKPKMSQHISKSMYGEVPVTVCIGWDRMLAYFFLAVEAVEIENGKEFTVTVYNSLDETDCFMINELDRIKAKLTELNIAVPETVFTEVVNDKNSNAGNRIGYHDTNGFKINEGW